MENISLPNDLIASFKKFRSNYEAANSMHIELKEHIGKYVAVDDGKILGYTSTYEEAMEKYGTSESVFIDIITASNIYWVL